MKENSLVSNNDNDSYDTYDKNSYNDNMSLLENQIVSDRDNRLFMKRDDQFSNSIYKYRSSLIIIVLLSAAGLLGNLSIFQIFFISNYYY